MNQTRISLITVLSTLILFSGLLCAQPIRPVTDRLDAIVAYPLVLAVQVEDERDLARGVTTRLDDGRTFVSTPYWVGLVPHSSLPAWISSAGRWEATTYEQTRSTPIAQRPPGSWFIAVPLPIDAVGQGLWFDQTRYELNWLPDPERSLLEADSAQRTRDFGAFWALRLDEYIIQDPAVQSAIDQYRRDPFQNWRARLLIDGLDPSRTRARETQANSSNTLELIEKQSRANEVLTSIARQQEARWQIILGRIWLIDPATATRMKQVLMRTARFSSRSEGRSHTRTLPLWTGDANGLARLAHDLLSPFVDDQTRVLRAKAWLVAQPRMLSWIIDDQGQLEAGTERLLPTLGVISLPSTPGESLLRIDMGADAPLLSTVPPDQLHRVQVPIDNVVVDPASPMIETVPVTLHLAQRNARHELIASAVPARAPFIRIGPMLNDWTMSSLMNDRPLESASPDPTRATLGILRSARKPGRNNPRAGWQLYIECASLDPTRSGDTLTIWVGPFQQPIAAWRISPDGRTETIAGNTTIVPTSVETSVLSDRWIAQITLPQDAFDELGQLMLGLERDDADSVHSAWPRRMFPGQSQPGRIIITPDRFDQLRLRAAP